MAHRLRPHRRNLIDHELRRDAGLARRESMIEVSVSVGAPRGRLTVTVGSNGDILGLELAGGALGDMAPAELASTVLATVRKAQRLAREPVDDRVVPLIFGGPDATIVEVLAGEVDIDSLTAGPPPPAALTA